MEQRRLRLGDVVDDYCPRERRVTNHAVVAIIDDEIRQTRCTTCDTEHVYKGARVPARRRKKETPGLYEQVLAGMTEQQGDGAALPDALPDEGAGEEETPRPEPRLTARAPAATAEQPDAPAEEAPGPQPPVGEGPVHRPLIRATLPRPEGAPAARPAPDFTIRQAAGRNGHFRDADPRQRRQRPVHAGGNGGRPPHGGVARHAGPRIAKPGRPGHRAGAHQTPHGRHGRPSPPARGGKKRSR